MLTKRTHFEIESVSAVRWLVEKSEFASDGHLKMKWSKQGKLVYSGWKSIDFETINAILRENS